MSGSAKDRDIFADDDNYGGDDPGECPTSGQMCEYSCLPLECMLA